MKDSFEAEKPMLFYRIQFYYIIIVVEIDILLGLSKENFIGYTIVNTCLSINL